MRQYDSKKCATRGIIDESEEAFDAFFAREFH